MKTFNLLDIHPSLQRALADLTFSEMTPIQAQAIPALLEGKDIIACAQTGTGKTFAFLLPILSRLLEREDSGKALVLVPTRELATQVAEGAKKLLAHAPEMRGVLLIGGSSMDYQTRMLRKNPRIIVATPGRLLDHLQRRSISLGQCRYLVLDEADRMLDMGFAPQLREILRALPEQRQTMLFSATVPDNIQRLSQDYLVNPVRISVDRSAQAAPKITQTSKEVSGQEKLDCLLEEITTREGLILVFGRTQIRCDRLANSIQRAGHNVSCIHGGKRQRERDQAIYSFRTGESRILVATDIAARGIDIAQVEHVINFDLPTAPEDYVHRIGRTGRAGKEGQALSLISHEEKNLWRAITRLLHPGAKFEGGTGGRPTRWGAPGEGGGAKPSRGGGRSFGAKKGSDGQRRKRFSKTARASSR